MLNANKNSNLTLYLQETTYWKGECKKSLEKIGFSKYI